MARRKAKGMPRHPAPTAAETREIARALAALSPNQRRQVLADAQKRARWNSFENLGRCPYCGRRFSDCAVCRADPWPWPTLVEMDRREKRLARKRSGAAGARKASRNHELKAVGLR